MRISFRRRVLLVSACLLIGAAGWAQQSQKPAVSTDLAVTFAAERSQVVPSQCCFWFKGGGADAAVTFWKGLGIAASITGDHASNVTPGVDVNKFTYMAGPRYTWNVYDSVHGRPRLQIFGQGLAGGVHGFDGLYPNGIAVTSSANALAIQAGGGLNFYLTKRFGLRLLEAEYVRTELPNNAANVQNDLRLSAGLVYHLGAATPPPPLTLSGTASPASIFPGDPVTVTATAGNVSPKQSVVYIWTGVAGLKGNGATVMLDAAASSALAPGTYTVKGEVKEGRPGKEGLRPGEKADCSASFTVKAFEPPTISCSASPLTLNPGGKSTITAAGISPQNRPLTYSYSAASGTISGTGASAVFDSTGVTAGPVAVTCKVSDDKGQIATASTNVTIAPPPPPPAPPAEQVRLETRLALHSVFFPTAQPRAENSEGGLVASQQAILATLATDFKSYLQFKPDAHLILTGHADVRGSAEYNKTLSDRRVARTKQFLVLQGISEAAIETQGLGSQEELSVDQVKTLVEQNPELSDQERAKVLRDLSVIVLAQNRRVDITLSTTGQQSVRLYPFNAADSLTLLEKSSAPKKKAAAPAK
ncbi:MAG: OmpA family protein [Terracidiphilus sp.]|jgi:outer membrane protein OmpA-like peptidoglycan-associated protein